MIAPQVRRVDAFTGPGCAGNAAGVVLLDAAMAREAMQAMARDIGLPATAFVAPPANDGRHPVRWFDPRGGEIALCGHGSLAAGHVLLSAGDETHAGLVAADGRVLDVRRMAGESRYELALPAIPTESRDLPEIAAAVGGDPCATRWNEAGYAILAYRDVAAIRALEPDFAALAACGRVQVTATAPGECAADVASRVFTHSGGGGEDMATGSAHAALAPYWCARLGVDRFEAWQASPRGGWFSVRLEQDRVWLGGACTESG